jgi:hypothetical protein
MWVASAATRISKRMKYTVYGEDIAQPAINLLAIILLAFVGLKVGGAIVAVIISYGFALGLLLTFIGQLYPSALAAPFGSDINLKDLLVSLYQLDWQYIYIDDRLVAVYS